MKRTVTNWEGLSKVLNDMNISPIIIKTVFNDDRLESLTFQSRNDTEVLEDEV